MGSIKIRTLLLASLLLALCLILPFLTGQIPVIGQALSPMHLPVLICGFACSWQYGLIVGLIAPVLRSALFGMPPMFPTAVAMSLELAAYGCIAGLLYRAFPKKGFYLYLNLLIAMVCGRIVSGITKYILAGLTATTFSLAEFFSATFVATLPAAALQLILVPLIVAALQKGGYIADPAMLEMEAVLRAHAARYPLMQPQDTVKLIYQNTYGCGHFVTRYQECLERLESERSHTKPDTLSPLTEDIGGGYLRVNLSAPSQLRAEALAKLFIASARPAARLRSCFQDKLSIAQKLADRGLFASFDGDMFRAYVLTYKKSGCEPVSHSDAYREAYHPAYRVVRKSLMKRYMQ